MDFITMEGRKMNSFTEDLIQGEKVLAVSRKNWTYALNKRNIIGFLVALLLLRVIPMLSIIVIVVLIILTVLEYMNTELVLTNMRLRGKQGVFKIETVENKASYFVGNFKTKSNVICSALGSNTIIVESVGVKTYVFTHMKKAKEMSNALYSLGAGNEVHIVNKF